MDGTVKCILRPGQTHRTGFVTWVGDALKGNFGDSWKYTVPVLDKFKEVIWLSFVMGAISFVLELIIAIPLGVIAEPNSIPKQTT